MAAPLRTDGRLYGILDLGYVAPLNAVGVAREMIAGGVDLLQLRAKRLARPEILELARLLRPITAAAGVPFIINDHPDLAAAVAADGVHLGQEDGPLPEARLGGGIAGRSTHRLDQARAARAEGADYLGFGPLFATPTKPDYASIGLDDIARVHAEVADRPIFCIGGIKLENLPRIIEAGARRAVIVSGLLLAADVAGYARKARALLPG